MRVTRAATPSRGIVLGMPDKFLAEGPFESPSTNERAEFHQFP